MGKGHIKVIARTAAEREGVWVPGKLNVPVKVWHREMVEGSSLGPEDHGENLLQSGDDEGD